MRFLLTFWVSRRWTAPPAAWICAWTLTRRAFASCPDRATISRSPAGRYETSRPCSDYRIVCPARASPWKRGSQDQIADRRVAGLIRFNDPEGNAHEAYFGPLQKTNQPFVSPLGVRFKTGRQGLGHLVLNCRDKPAMMDFFLGTLGFRLTDHIRTEVVPGRPIEISFMRCNGRHHSLAFAPTPLPKRILHLMLETTSIDDVGRALYRCIQQNIHLSFTLGRHSNDEMLSFYPMTPSGFDIEYGWGVLEVDDDLWRVLTHDHNSAWGHIFQRPPRPDRPREA